MRVQRVVMPETEFESWTVLGDDQLPVEPVERFLAYLASIEKSPNTIKAYAHDLKDWFTYLVAHRRDWRTATLEDVAGFVAWLRLPPKVRDGKVVVLPTVEHHCSVASVNRKLAALTSFCGFPHGVELAGLLVTPQPANRRGGAATAYTPFLHHVTKTKPEQRCAITLKTLRHRTHLRKRAGVGHRRNAPRPHRPGSAAPGQRRLTLGVQQVDHLVKDSHQQIIVTGVGQPASRVHRGRTPDMSRKLSTVPSTACLMQSSRVGAHASIRRSAVCGTLRCPDTLATMAFARSTSSRRPNSDDE